MRFFRLIAFSLLLAGSARAQSNALYQTVARLDSSFFAAYNTCDLERQAAFYADSIEFFHDRSGLDTSKTKILANTRKYVCGRVTRELVPGSLEVSPLPGYGAVAVGLHRFRNSAEPDAESRASRFVIVWRELEGRWQITKVISLH